jgi:hypothetical protein
MKLQYWTKQLHATLKSVELAKSVKEKVTFLNHLAIVAQQAADDGKTWLPKDSRK